MKKRLALLAALLLLTGCSRGNTDPAPTLKNPDAGQSTAQTPPQDDTKDAAQDAAGAPGDTADNGGTSDGADNSADVYTLAFEAKTLDGADVDSSVFGQTKLTMVNVWATFCNPCIREMPELAALNAEGGEDYQIIGLCSDLDGTDEMLATAKEVVAQTGADYLHLQPSESLLPVLTASSAVPVSFFFDSEGRLVGNGVLGAQDKDAWAKEIQNRLAMVQSDDGAE